MYLKKFEEKTIKMYKAEAKALDINKMSRKLLKLKK